jgi:UDP-N-acetylmuramoylalanine-D-glutamate ligase
VRGATVIGVDHNCSCKQLNVVEDIERYLNFGRNDFAKTAEVDRCLSVGSFLRTELGDFKEATFQIADIIVLSPGVPLTQPQVAAALCQTKQGSKCTVISELAFASQCLPKMLPIVAISGTNGKSTVCSFTAQLLASCDCRTFMGGNIGKPLSDCALEFILAEHICGHLADLGHHWPYDAAVVECSSYQLDHPGTLRFDAACILNLTPDHLERHKSMANYATAKTQIFAGLRGTHTLAVLPKRESARGRHQSYQVESDSTTDHIVDLDYDGATLLEKCREAVIKTLMRRVSETPNERVACIGGRLAHIGSLPGVKVDLNTKIAIVHLPSNRSSSRQNSPSYVDLSAVSSLGTHNILNASIALLMAHSLSPKDFTVARLKVGLDRLKLLPHRMQLVAQTGNPSFRGIHWVNDSKATNIEAAIVGLQSYGRRALVLLGK